MIGKLTPEVFHDSEEMVQRAVELSRILHRPIHTGFEVFVALAQQGIIENRRWTYIRKNKSLVAMQLSVTALKDHNEKIVGYLGVAIDSSDIKF